MLRVIVYSVLLVFSSCSTVNYFVVRHAEKETPSAGTVMSTPNDPPLAPAGKVRAIELREELKNEKISYIYSTNTIRTVNTAKPLSELTGIPVTLYNTRDSLDYLIGNLKKLEKGNILIVGHSNTVDDVVNKLIGEVKIPKDLPDSEYDNLYKVVKKGKKMKFENKTYGTATD